jgi:hypothetical protein
MAYDWWIKIATTSSMNVSPLPWLQYCWTGIFCERLNVFVEVRPAAATTFTGCRHRMSLPSYSLLNMRICIPASHLTVTTCMESIRSSTNSDLFSIDYNKDCIVSPEEVRLAVNKFKPRKMTVVSDFLLITSFTHALRCLFTSQGCFPHWLFMVLHLVIYRYTYAYR